MDVLEIFGGHFAGDLQLALLLLLEPADEYFAHKLHGGFFGLKRTPEMSKQILLGSSHGKLWDRLQVSRGLMTHDDTVVGVIALRFGRDLSAVARTYERLYEKSLLQTISDHTHYDLCRLLHALVAGACAR